MIKSHFKLMILPSESSQCLSNIAKVGTMATTVTIFTTVITKTTTTRDIVIMLVIIATL